MGIDGGAVAAWELGRIGVPDDRAKDLADALGIDPREFVMVLLRHTDPWLYSALYGMDADPCLRKELAQIPERLERLTSDPN